MERTSADDTDSAAAAPNACAARTTRRNGRLLAKKHSTVATANTTCPPWYSRFSPIRSPRPEKGSSAMTSTSWYTVTTDTAALESTWRSRAIVGSATVAMAPSTTTRAVPADTAAMARKRRGVGKPSVMRA